MGHSAPVHGAAQVAVLRSGRAGDPDAHDFAAHSAQVRLFDVSEQALATATHRMRVSTRTLVRLGVWSADQAAASDRCLVTTDLASAVSDVALVIEAAPEQRAVKVELLQRVEELCPQGAILGTNSSTYTAAELADGLTDPGRLVNAHFFNPPQLIPVVEVCS